MKILPIYILSLFLILISTTSCLEFEPDHIRDAIKDPESINFLPNSPARRHITLEDWGIRILWSNRSNFEDGFIIERSINSSSFSFIARLPTRYQMQEDGRLVRNSQLGYSDTNTNLIYSSKHIKYRVYSYAIRQDKMNINPNYAEFSINIQ